MTVPMHRYLRKFVHGFVTRDAARNLLKCILLDASSVSTSLQKNQDWDAVVSTLLCYIVVVAGVLGSVPRGVTLNRKSSGEEIAIKVLSLHDDCFIH